LSAEGVLDSQIIQAENGDVIKQSCECNQAATATQPVTQGNHDTVYSIWIGSRHQEPSHTEGADRYATDTQEFCRGRPGRILRHGDRGGWRARM
jgi:hypothetical protein